MSIQSLTPEQVVSSLDQCFCHCFKGCDTCAMADKSPFLEDCASDLVEMAIALIRNQAKHVAELEAEIQRVGESATVGEYSEAHLGDDDSEMVRCAQCIYRVRNEDSQKLGCGIHDLTLMEITDQSFCSPGMTPAQWLALYGGELEDGDPLKQK